MANRYWVGGTANWDGTAGSKWSTTSGGAGGSAEPTASDDVFFDANSGANTITITSDATVKSINFTGFTGTFTGSSTINIEANFTLVSGMTYSYSGQLYWNAFPAIGTLTTAGKTIADIRLGGNNSSYLTLGDALTCSGNFIHSRGTLDANNQNVIFTGTGINDGAGGFSKWLVLGSGTWDFRTTSTFNYTGATPTVTANTSTIKFSSRTGASTFNPNAGATFNNLWIANGATSNNVFIYGDNTFADIKDDGTVGHTIYFETGKTQTVTTFTVSGNSGQLISINSHSGGSANTGTHALAKAGGGTISRDYLNIQHSVATPASTWYAGANSTNNQAVATAGSGWTFSAPTTTNIKTYNTNLQANIKTIDTNAIANVKTLNTNTNT